MTNLTKVNLSLVVLAVALLAIVAARCGFWHPVNISEAQHFPFYRLSVPKPQSSRLVALVRSPDGLRSYNAAFLAPRGAATPPSEDEILGTNGEFAAEKQAELERARQEKQVTLQKSRDYIAKQVAELKEEFEHVANLPEMTAFLASSQSLNALEVAFKREYSSTDDTRLKADKLRGIVENYVKQLDSHRVAWEAMLFVLRAQSSHYSNSLDNIENLQSTINVYKSDVSSADMIALMAPVAQWDDPYRESENLYFDVFRKFDDALKQKRIDDNGEARYQMMMRLSLAWLERDLLVSDE